MKKLIIFFNVVVMFGLAQMGHATDDENDYLYDLTLPEVVRKDYGVFVEHIRNTEVDPCDDFYAYACGNWDILNMTDAHQWIEIKKDNLWENLLKDLGVDKKEIEPTFKFEGEESASLTPPERKAISFFQSCMKEDLINDRKFEAIKGFLKTIDGYPLKQEERGGMRRPGMGRRRQGRPRMPNLREIHAAEFDWVNMSAYLQPFGINAIFSLHIEDGTKYFDLDDFQETLTEIRRTVLEHDVERIKYNESRIWEIVSVFAEGAAINNAANDIIYIDRSFYQAQKYAGEKSSLIEYFSFEELEKMLPNLRLLEFIRIFDDRYTENQKIGVRNLETLREISKSKAFRLGENSLRAYLLFRTVYHLLQINENISVSNCARRTRNYMRLPSDVLFLRFYLNENIVADVTEIFKYVKKEYKIVVEQQDLDEDLKNQIINKIENSTINVGYNKNPKIIQLLEYEYGELEINLDEYFKNVLDLLEIEQVHFGGSQNYPTDFGVKYDSEHNSFTVQAGTLLLPFYHQGVPMWGKFGNLGTILGKKFNYALSNFSDTFCYARRNKSFHRLGDVSLNIADVKGVKLSFEAYKKWAAENPELSQTESYEKLNLSPEQLFFLAGAQGTCSKGTSGSNLFKANVVNTLKNLKEFSVAYNCPLGSRMNPVNKCSV